MEIIIILRERVIVVIRRELSVGHVVVGLTTCRLWILGILRIRCHSRIRLRVTHTRIGHLVGIGIVVGRRGHGIASGEWIRLLVRVHVVLRGRHLKATAVNDLCATVLVTPAAAITTVPLNTTEQRSDYSIVVIDLLGPQFDLLVVQ